MLCVILPDSTVHATHEDYLESTILGHPGYAGQRVVRTTDVGTQPGDPEPAGAEVVREASAP